MECSDKPFKSIDEQVSILSERGMETDGRTSVILLREGYYQVINGYKAPFLDVAATEAANGEDRYRPGVTFNDLYSLFRFDRDLRETTFHYLLRVEALVRTVVSYTFAESHRDCDDYLDQASFATEAEYNAYGLEDYRKNLHVLLDILYRKVERSERDFIVHYRENHGCVPFWILAGDLTFGNIEHFFNLMKPAEQALCCRRIVEATGMIGSRLGFFNPDEARIGLNLIVKMRNMCAHDERLYCAKIGNRQNASFVDMLGYIQRYLPEKEMTQFVQSAVATVGRYSNKSDMVKHILTEMGFGELVDEFAASMEEQAEAGERQAR